MDDNVSIRVGVEMMDIISVGAILFFVLFVTIEVILYLVDKIRTRNKPLSRFLKPENIKIEDEDIELLRERKKEAYLGDGDGIQDGE